MIMDIYFPKAVCDLVLDSVVLKSLPHLYKTFSSKEFVGLRVMKSLLGGENVGFLNVSVLLI